MIGYSGQPEGYGIDPTIHGKQGLVDLLHRLLLLIYRVVECGARSCRTRSLQKRAERLRQRTSFGRREMGETCAPRPAILACGGKLLLHVAPPWPAGRTPAPVSCPT